MSPCMKILAGLSMCLLLLAFPPATKAEQSGAYLGEMVMGSDDAPVTIIEYASMSCSHCASFHSATLPSLKKKYIDSGKLRMVFREFAYDRTGFAAATLARCAGKKRFFPFVKLLFEKQRQWALSEDYGAALKQIAKVGGIGSKKYDACMADAKLKSHILNNRIDAQKKYDIKATPSFIIDGETHAGALTIGDFDRLLAGLTGE